MSLLKLRNLAVSNSYDKASAYNKLNVAIRNGIIRLKQLSRSAGNKQAYREILSIDRNAVDNIRKDHTLADFVSARQYSKNFADLWLSKAVGDSFRGSARAANIGSVSRLEMIAATESSKSFNDGRNEVCEAYRGPARLFKVWDSTLDATSCHYCSSNNGEMVPIAENFSFGEPGYLHPNCCCTFSILTDLEIE